jgi:hypothetical protein
VSLLLIFGVLFQIFNSILFFCSEAFETRHALHGVKWPDHNPKKLHVEFSTEEEMNKVLAPVEERAPSSAATAESSRDSKSTFGWSKSDVAADDRSKVSFVSFLIYFLTKKNVFRHRDVYANGMWVRRRKMNETESGMITDDVADHQNARIDEIERGKMRSKLRSDAVLALHRVR